MLKSTERLENIKNISKQIMEKHPDVAIIECMFNGCGDSFSDFNDVTIKDKNGSDINGENDPYEKNREIFEDLFWNIIEYDGRANFNDDGSEGNITIDLINNKIKIEVSYFESISQSQGENEFNDLMATNKKKPVEFSSFAKTKKSKVKKEK